MAAAQEPQTVATDFLVEVRMRLPAHLSNQLGEIAQQLQLSRAALVRLIIRDWIRAHKDTA